ncbi:MAG TPA: TrkA C-terminal domain-containing protein, partial [Nocardioidaceae bacterium]|nr:TrkA C-terminal domain-containing protein [Nocardioidaceae bacterium]
LLTGPTMPWVARALRVAIPEEPRDLDVESAPLDRVAADLLQVSVTGRSLLHGVEVAELRLPAGAAVSLVVREGQTLVPDPRMVLRHGDDLLVVAARRVRDETERRLQAVSRAGRLARWHDG